MNPVHTGRKPTLDFGHADRSPPLSTLAATPAHQPPYRFGRFELQPEDRRLLADDAPVALGARAFDLLVTLVGRAGQLVSKNDLLTLVWPGLVVEENNLQVQISALRKLLGPQVIATIPGRGYRFTAVLDGTDEANARAELPGASPAAKQPHAFVAPPTNLPAELPLLYGRDADLTALRSLVDGHKLVTVVGAGGIGKSSLALAMAQSLAGRWPDGAWLVELAGLSDPALLPNAVAQTLNIALPGQHAAQDDLVAGIAPWTALLVLDNCEHLLDAAATLAQALMTGAPNVRLLATSQEPLRLPAEQQYRVTPLALPPEATASGAREYGAVALFEARVRAVDPRFALNDENLALVIDICRRLDGLPLAIELAAARVATLGLRPVRDKLDARFKLLTGGSRATLRRHQTLRAALEWSHHLLNDAEQAVFRRLGVFVGGFTMELAQAVAGDAQLDEWAVLDQLSALLDKSLVVADAGDTPRYRLLESARAFALEQLAAGETAATLRRHALAIRTYFDSVDGPHLDGELLTEELRALLLPERDNLRAAHAWATGGDGDLEVAVALAACASALEDFAFESADWLVPLQPPVEDGAVSTSVAARYWRAMASANMTMTGRVPQALQLLASERARTLYLALGQPRRAFSSLVLLAIHRMTQQQGTAAQEAADEARSLMQPDWPAMLRIRLLRLDGHLARLAGRPIEALALYRDAVRVSVSTRDWLLEMIARANLADFLWETGPLEDAAREARAVVDELRERPLTDLDMAHPFAMAIGILSEMGRIDEASALAREALPLMRHARETFVEEWVYLFWRRGQLDFATRLLGASDAERARVGTPLQANERRLIAEARPALEARLPPDAFARGLAAGAVLDTAGLFALIAEALAQRDENH
jgi:predicted ATPase/DNA-binding winged helix-turn-helix (wHTH) protein